jgi:hypothetical protein
LVFVVVNTFGRVEVEGSSEFSFVKIRNEPFRIRKKIPIPGIPGPPG